jgi:hypothetical protein
MTESQTFLTQHLVNSNSALNKKVDKLAEALEALTIGDDLKDYIGRLFTFLTLPWILIAFFLQ